MATYPDNKKKLLKLYPLAWLISYFSAMVLVFLWSLIPGNSGDGFSPIAIPIVFTLMFLMCVIVYFYVPLSSWLLLLLMHDFVMKDRGGKLKSALISSLLAAACWAVTFPVALACVNLITAGNQFLQIQESSTPFLYLFGGSNLIGLVGALLWVKLRAPKAN